MRAWLKELRESRGMTMKTLSEKLDISESYYCGIENGTRQRSMDIVIAAGLSVALDVPIDQIVQYERNYCASCSP